MRGTGSAAIVATLEHHCAVVALPSVLFRQTWRWLQRQGRRSQFRWPNQAHKLANSGLAVFSVRGTCHKLSRQRALDGAVCELRRSCRRRISRCELRRAHSGLLRVGCHQETHVLLFGIHQLLEEGVFSGAACSEFRQLGLSACSSDARLQLALGDAWRWSRHIGEGLVEHLGDGRRATDAVLLKLWLSLLRLRWLLEQ